MDFQAENRTFPKQGAEAASSRGAPARVASAAAVWGGGPGAQGPEDKSPIKALKIPKNRAV